jgi:signal peptidase I
MKEKTGKFLNELRFYTAVTVLATVFAVGLRVFVVTSIIKIPSGSMEPAVLAGDRIIVTKLIPGARVYKDIRQIRIDGKVQTERFKGIRRVGRNDVLVFNFSYSGAWDRIDMDLSVFYLKRCVALPGDTFSIQNGIYSVNDSLYPSGCTFRQRALSQKSQNDFSSAVWRSFPYDTTRYLWNIRDFGPLYVPAAGVAIPLDTVNCVLYKRLVEYETDKKLSIRDGLVYLDEKCIDNYTFRLNYYFMAGDNIFDSQDSRYWGLLPEDCIIGKAIFVLRSTDMYSKKIRWNRILKRIK